MVLNVARRTEEEVKQRLKAGNCKKATATSLIENKAVYEEIGAPVIIYG